MKLNKGNWKTEISISDYDMLQARIDLVDESTAELNEVLRSLTQDELETSERDRLGRRMRVLCAEIQHKLELVRGTAKELVGEPWDSEAWRKNRPQ